MGEERGRGPKPGNGTAGTPFEYGLAAYGGKSSCAECDVTIHAGIVRWCTASWVRCICTDCHDQAWEVEGPIDEGGASRVGDP